MRFIVVTLLILIAGAGYSQRTLSTKSKKAAELYREADNFRVRGQLIQAQQLLEESIKKDKNFHEAYFRLAIICKAQGETGRAEELLLKSEQLNQGNKAGIYFELGELYMQQSSYGRALDYIHKFLELNPRNKRRLQEAELIKANAEFAMAHEAAQATFDPKPLSDTINAFAMQYFPVLSVDGNTLIYTRRMGSSPVDDEDIVLAVKDADGLWQSPVSISENINSRNNEGTCTLSADGRTLIFTSCVGRQGYGSCDLYISEKSGDEWSAPKNLGRAVNSSSWDSQPSLSADGRTLYFISNRPGGIGRRDIWISKKNNDGDWQKPVNAGPMLNTVQDEVSPFIHPNDKILYYATNGLPGFGGFDIFYSENNGEWQKPINIGAPINSGDDQVSLFVDSQGEKGYYSHEALNTNRKGLLYEFDLSGIHAIKYKTSWVKGVVTDAKSKLPLNAKIELHIVGNDEVTGMVTSDSINGSYLMVLPQGAQYSLYIEMEGYLFQSLNFEYKDELEPINIDIQLDPLSAGVYTRLNNIFFDIDSHELREESYPELNKIVALLKNNPDLQIEIEGHTDDQGESGYNERLSEARAGSVKSYIVNRGIPEKKITTKGYGSTKPIESNGTAFGRQRNRRIEFKIVGI